MARFIHIGDLHLGPNSRNEDRMAALDQIIREAPRPISAWLFPGDLNHGRMTIADRNFLAARLKTMGDEAPVLICYGNHDLPGDLDVFALLATVWPIRVLARPQTVCFATPTKDLVAAFVLSYPMRGPLVGSGVPSDQVVGAARQALDVIFMQAAVELREATASGHIPLMIGHVNVAGSIVSSGQPNIGTEIEIDRALLDQLGPIYKGLNHIHKGQQIAGAWYPGSCCRLDWGEIEEKRYLEIQYEIEPGGMTHSDVWLHDVREHRIDVAPMYRVEGELTSDGFRWALAGETNAGPLEWVPPQFPETFTGAEVRVRYRFNADERSALDESLVRVPFEGAKRLELDPIAVRNRASRAPEVAAAVTLEGKVEAFVERSELRWSESLAAKLADLQKPDGAAFLTEVQQGLSGAGEANPVATESLPLTPSPAVKATLADPAPGKELAGVRL